MERQKDRTTERERDNQRGIEKGIETNKQRDREPPLDQNNKNKTFFLCIDKVILCTK
jgi:hypothetical protein